MAHAPTAGLALGWIRHRNFDLRFIAGSAALAIAVVVYRTINFHHYIVDGLIWKVRSPKLRSTLGLAGMG